MLLLPIGCTQKGREQEMTLTPVLLSIAPIFLLIVLGYLLRRNGIPNVDFWNMNDKIVYWVLMPALLFYKTSTAEFSLHLVGSYSIVIIGGFLAALIFGISSAKLAHLPGDVASSVMQGAARHNAFCGRQSLRHDRSVAGCACHGGVDPGNKFCGCAFDGFVESAGGQRQFPLPRH